MEIGLFEALALFLLEPKFLIRVLYMLTNNCWLITQEQRWKQSIIIDIICFAYILGFLPLIPSSCPQATSSKNITTQRAHLLHTCSFYPNPPAPSNPSVVLTRSPPLSDSSGAIQEPLLLEPKSEWLTAQSPGDSALEPYVVDVLMLCSDAPSGTKDLSWAAESSAGGWLNFSDPLCIAQAEDSYFIQGYSQGGKFLGQWASRRVNTGI